MAATMHVPHEVHMADLVLDDPKRQRAEKMGSTVLDDFNKLKSDNDSVRLDAGVKLLNHLHRCNTNQDDKEFNYALTRLVRSLGSSQTFTRRGNYSTLTAFLAMYPDISIEKVLSIMDAELYPTGSNPKSENADIYMGRILLCGALIRSKLLGQKATESQQRQIVQILLHASIQRIHLSLISVMFLSEFINQIDVEPVKNIWPIVEEGLGKPWSEQTLDSFYVLLVVRAKHPSFINHKFLKKHLGTKEIIAKETMENIIRLLTTPPKMFVPHHPAFKLFCEMLVATEFVTDFWHGIDQKFQNSKPSKHDEYITTEILQLILANVKDKTVIPSLLSPNLLQHMLKRFSYCKRSNNDKVLIAFREVLNLVVSATSDKDIKTKTQLSILKKLILDPGDLMIEKKTGIKVIQVITGNLRLDGIKKLSQLYRDIIENKMIVGKENANSDAWTNAERSYVAQLLTRLMGRQETLLDQDWRLAQLTFLFNHGLCLVPHVGVELASQFKDSFYRALDYKLPKLGNVRNLLSALVHDLNSKLRSNAIQLRSPLSEAAFNAWKKVTDLIEKLEKHMKNVEALPIFHTMNLHMSLQLFSNPEMAITSINELQCCYERLNKKSKEHTKLNNAAAAKEEPQWVEVVVDLLLSLLSRNDHLLRSLVGCVFPHICPYLTPSAVYQIVAVLDIKNDQNTLTTKQSDDQDSSDVESESDDNNDEEEEENISNDEVSSEGNEFENDASEDEDENEDEDDEDEDEIEDEDETITDKLRMAVRQALGDAATQTDDEDIDIDEIDEEEGKRLDRSLAAAFKILRENRQTRSKKQGKTSETLMHFRGRVIDLLHIYLDTCPSMAVTLDMIIPLFALLEFCIKDPHQKPLEHRVRACLKKLSTVRKFKDTAGVDDTFLTTVLKALIEKRERCTSICQEISDKLADCCTFLVRCMQQVNLSTESVIEIYSENLTAFFKKRDCTLSSMLFKSVLQMCWEDNWQLALLLVNFAFDSSIRYYRRSQALDLLAVFYNNHRLLSMDTKYAEVRTKIETTLYKNTIDTFKETHDLYANDNEQSTSCNGVGVQKKILQKFIGHLLMLLRVVRAHHLPQAWNWQTVKTILTMHKNQSILSKDAKVAYNKLMMQIKAPLDTSLMKDAIGTNNSIDIVAQSNGKRSNIGSQNGKESDSEEETALSNKQKKKKKKSKQRDKQLLKKDARELRAKAMSKDLELFKFSNVNLTGNEVEDTIEILQNGDSVDKTTDSKLLQKRNRGQSVEENCQTKRRKSNPA